MGAFKVLKESSLLDGSNEEVNDKVLAFREFDFILPVALGYRLLRLHKENAFVYVVGACFEHM